MALLAAASPEATIDALAELSIAERDAHLLKMRQWAFGAQMTGLVTCHGCGERLELNFSVKDISPWPDGEVAGLDEPFCLSTGDYELHFRLPNSHDLSAVAIPGDLAERRRQLFERCVLAVREAGEERSVDQIPDDVVDAVAEAMGRADPMADLQIALSCPACERRWKETFDIVSFFWREIDAWARRLLRDVHKLASAYGWREADILEMTPRRRQFYLEMVGG